MYIKNVLSKFNNNFGTHEVLIIENPEIHEANCVKILKNNILSALKAESINILEYSISYDQITIVTINDKTYKFIKPFIKSSFGSINLQKKKANNNYYYEIKIKIVDLDNLLHYLNQQAIFSLYQLTNTIPKLVGKQIKVSIPSHMNIDNIKKIIQSSKNIKIRLCSGKIVLPVCTGGVQNVSEPILEDSFENQIINQVTIYDKNKLIVHLSPWGIEKINELRISHSGYNIAFEIDNMIYSIFTLKDKKYIPKDIPFVECKDQKEARNLLKIMNIGYFSRLKIVAEEQSFSVYSFMYFLFLLIINLILIAAFLKLVVKRRLLISFLISMFLSLYLGSSFDGQISDILLINNILLSSLFLLITKINDNLTPSYVIFTLFFINIILLGISKTYQLPLLHQLSNGTSLFLIIILLCYHFVLLINIKKNT